jgi:hypothetical protein
VDPDGVSPELSSDAQEFSRRRADIAVGWATVAAEHRRRRRAYGLAGTASSLGFGLAVLAAALVPVYLSMHGVLAEHALGWLVPTTMLGTMAVGLSLWFWWYAASGRPARTASTEFGRPSSAIEDGQADMEREARRLRLARNASPRLDYLRASSRAATGWADVVIAVATAGPVLLTAGWLSADMARGTEPYDWRVWLLWPVPVVAGSVVALLRRRRRRRRRAIEDALGKLAAYLNGRLLVSPADTVDWLNRCWAAASEPGDYYAGPLHGGAAGRALGYPAMVDVEPDGLCDETVTFLPRAVVYLAALPTREPAAAQSDRACQLRARISDAGFTADIDPDAGLVARATAPALRGLRANLAELGNLGPLIGDLAALAAVEGLAPAPEGELPQ